MTTTTLPDRADVQLAAVVDIALELLEARGQRSAVAFLVASGAGFGTICRVLTDPGRRRRPLPLNVLPFPRLHRG
jgi:hypothetical protein